MRIAAKRARRAGLSMTSLIDVIFLLLLFFMLTSTFVRHQQVDIAAPAPEGASGGSVPDVLLRAQAEGAISINGETIEQNGLVAHLTGLREAGGEKLLIKVDEGADSQTLVGAVEAARRAGFAAISVAD
ncbi:biopolymer transporter ExbD [Fulvimarina sp. MAC8]|uniref:ExbD/TolR family protein n=1 Tax=Fulvimarina sp. MAC8 TaxID=3162874 RepID=UPI0032EE6904